MEGVGSRTCQSGMQCGDAALQALLPSAQHLQPAEARLLAALLEELLLFHNVVVLQLGSQVHDSLELEK